MNGASDDIRAIIQEVLSSYDLTSLIDVGRTAHAAPPRGAPAPGIFGTIDLAVSAAATAQRELVQLPLDTRRRMIEAIRTGGHGRE